MRVLSRVLRFIDSMNDKQGRFVSLFVLIVAAMFCWEVLLRGVFTAPTIWVHEGTQYFFGIYFMLGGAYAFLHKAHVNVDIFYGRFSPRGKAIADVITATIVLLVCWMLMQHGWTAAWTSLKTLQRSNTVWAGPIYIPKTMVFVGAVTLTLQAIAKLIRDVYMVVKRREIN